MRCKNATKKYHVDGGFPLQSWWLWTFANSNLRYHLSPLQQQNKYKYLPKKKEKKKGNKNPESRIKGFKHFFFFKCTIYAVFDFTVVWTNGPTFRTGKIVLSCLSVFVVPYLLHLSLCVCVCVWRIAGKERPLKRVVPSPIFPLKLL